MTHSPKRNTGAMGRVTLSLAIAAGGLLMGIGGGGLLWRGMNQAEKGVVREPVRSPASPKGSSKQGTTVNGTASPAPEAGGQSVVEADPAPPAPPAPPSEASRRMIRAVWDRGGAAGQMSPEQAAAWMQNFANIIRAGAASVPAIAEYLNASKDTVFTPEESRLIGFRNAREAMLHALGRMGGPEATAAMGAELRNTASPREVALLALSLEAAAPGQYHAQAMTAARESLAMAVEKQLGSLDVAPLFEVLQTFGGAEAVGDLERAAARYGQYATLALAALPDGAGVQSLLRIAGTEPNARPNPARLQALQVIAQLAASNDDVRAALVGQARAQRISPQLWPYLARPLSGEQARVQDPVLDTRAPVSDDARTGTTHIAGSNQNLVWARPADGLSPAQMERQLALVEELILLTGDPDGRRALEQARALIKLHSAPSTAGIPASQ